VYSSLFEKRKKYVIENRGKTPYLLFVVVEEAHNSHQLRWEGENYPSRTILGALQTEGRKIRALDCARFPNVHPKDRLNAYPSAILKFILKILIQTIRCTSGRL